MRPLMSRPFPAAELLAWYAVHGRAHLPWRRTRDPYRIAVSEFMLQQTQVERVLPLYEAFLVRFPSLAALAAAPVAEVVRSWKGLGYNNRAVRLRRLAGAVLERHGGEFPRERELLLALPGIGPYTAAAIRAFAFEIDDVAMDTNLRRVIHRVRFGFEEPRIASTAQLDDAARSAVPAGRAHDFNSALMDLGAAVCGSRAARCLICPLAAACAAAPIDPARLASAAALRGTRKPPQERVRFEDSRRFLRGRIVDRLRELPASEAISLLALQESLALAPERRADVPAVLEALASDGVLAIGPEGVRLA
jgi:A/G-specific adenine glycosylase